jgi:hypothetical protein
MARGVQLPWPTIDLRSFGPRRATIKKEENLAAPPINSEDAQDVDHLITPE